MAGRKAEFGRHSGMECSAQPARRRLRVACRLVEDT